MDFHFLDGKITESDKRMMIDALNDERDRIDEIGGNTMNLFNTVGRVWMDAAYVKVIHAIRGIIARHSNDGPV